MMFTAFCIFGRVEWGSTKLGGPDNERFIEQASRAEVAQQCGDWSVHIQCEASVVSHVPVGIPISACAGINEFYKSYSALDEPPSR